MSEYMKQPLGQLSPQPWMQAENTQKLLNALQAEGDEVRFVGGCVRDSVAHRPVADLDLATPALPEKVVALLERAGIRSIPTGLKHGTVTAVIDGTPFEITTLRRDVETDGRHAVVEFTDSWREDAARRDFTINALSCTPDGAIYDYFEGLDDLGQGLVRFVGIPRKRIEEDVLRLLRFFRFYAYYGTPPIDPDSLAACRVAAPELHTLSAERVRDELLKILAAPDPASILLLMQGEHVLEHLLPEASAFGRLRLMAWLETRGLIMESLRIDPLRRLAAVVNLSAEEAGGLAERLRFSRLQTKRLTRLCAPAFIPQYTMTEAEARHRLRQVGAEEFRDLVLLAWCGRRDVQARPESGETERWTALLEMAEGWTLPPFPLTGKDVLSAGLTPGKEVGRLLADMQQWWEESGFKTSREDLLAELHRRIAVSDTARKG